MNAPRLIQTELAQTVANAVAELELFTGHVYASIAVTRGGQLVYASPEILTVLGYAPTDLVGKPLTTIMPPRFHDAHRRGFINYVETGVRKLNWSEVRLPGLHRDGTERALVIGFTEAQYGHLHLICAAIRSDTVG